MNRCASIIFSAIFLLMVFFHGQGLAASITEATAAIGKDCVASGYASTAMGNTTIASGSSSTAMGYGTTASGPYSTAMGFKTTASGFASTAMGLQTTAESDYSWAGGRHMQLTDAAHSTFVWGYSTCGH